MVSNKSRLLRLYRYLYLNTDSEHYTTKNEIMDALRDGDTVYSRQTVRDDIDTLTREGYDVETVVSSGNYYYFRDREFTLEELRMMSDAVDSSRFISRRQKAQIRKKLKNFCSRYQAQTLDRHLISVEPSRKEDRSVLEMADLLHDAINRGRRVSFQLWAEDPQADADDANAACRRRAALAAEGAEFVCTPLDLVWDGERFFLVGLEDPDGTPALYALERLVRPLVLELAALPRPEGFRSEQFARNALDL